MRHIFHCQKNNHGTARLQQALGDIFHYFLSKRPRKRPLKAERRAAFKVRRSINAKGVKQSEIEWERFRSSPAFSWLSCKCRRTEGWGICNVCFQRILHPWASVFPSAWLYISCRRVWRQPRPSSRSSGTQASGYLNMLGLDTQSMRSTGDAVHGRFLRIHTACVIEREIKVFGCKIYSQTFYAFLTSDSHSL